MNRKGFTMVELLAVLVVMGVLGGVAIPSISNTVSKSHEDFCKANVDTLKNMAKEYYTDYQSLKPKTVGEKREVSLETLVKEKYTNEDMTDYENTKCNYKNSKVGIVKTTNSNYEYTYSLDCGKCGTLTPDNGFKNSTVRPEISYTPNEAHNTNNGDINVKIKFKDNGITILSYKYEIYKIENGQEVIVGGITNYKKYDNKDVDVKLSEKGDYKIKTTAINAVGNKTVETSGVYSLTYSLDSCKDINIKAEYQEDTNGTWKSLSTNEWHRGSFKFTIDKKGSIYSYDVFMTIDGGEEQLLINRATSSRELNYDKGSDGKRSHTYEIRVVAYDEKGTACTLGGDGYKFIYEQDNIPPTCHTSGGNGTANDSNWLNSYSRPDYIRIEGLAKDDEIGTKWQNSGIDTSRNVAENNRGFAIENGNAVRYLREDTNSYYSPGEIEDKAGNKTTCDSNQWVQIDKHKPTCTVTSENDGHWLNAEEYNRGKRVKLYGNCTDNSVTEYDGSGRQIMSGCKPNTYAEYGDKDMYEWLAPDNVADKAGNIGECDKKEVMVDKHGPTCQKMEDMLGWDNISSYDITATCTGDPKYDGASRSSGCRQKALYNSVSQEGALSTSAGTMYDQAGNGTVCPSTNTYIDRTPPTCNVSCYNCDYWTNGTASATATCTDYESGCSYYESENWDSDTNEETDFGPVTDEAGNVGYCPTHSIMIDQSPPDCQASDYSESISCDDGDGSGCYSYSSYCPANETGTVYDRAGNSCSDTCIERTPSCNTGNYCTPSPTATTADGSESNTIHYWFELRCGNAKKDHDGDIWYKTNRSDRNYTDYYISTILDSRWAEDNGCYSNSYDFTPYVNSSLFRACDWDTVCVTYEMKPKPKTTKSYYIEYRCGDSNKRLGPYYKTSSGDTVKVSGKTIHNNMPTSWLNDHKCSTTIASKSPQDHVVSNGGTMAVRLKKKTSSLTGCHIRGNTKRATSPWKCDTHHHTVSQYYTHYCVDSNGKLQSKWSNSSLVTYAYVCSKLPYHASDGWYVVDDSGGRLDGKSKYDVKIVEKP